jgi:hypothetical protein
MTLIDRAVEDPSTAFALTALLFVIFVFAFRERRTKWNEPAPYILAAVFTSLAILRFASVMALTCRLAENAGVQGLAGFPEGSTGG